VIRVWANGRAVELPDGSTVTALIEALGLARQVAAVERNGEPVPRSARSATALAEGDRIELVRAVAGG
jgi:thiamine biosynthesis protein ThiS